MSDSAPTEVTDARHLLEFVELDGIEVYELRARGIERDDDFEEGYFIQAAISFDAGLLRTKFALTFNAPTAEYLVDLAVRYRTTNEITLPPGPAVDFVEKVGAMAAWPYLREHVFGLAARLGRPVPVLGLIRQGDFHLTPEDATESDTASIELPES